MSSALINSFRPKRSYLHAFEAYDLPAEELIGWCIQYRVWAYGYAGQPIPEEFLRESLDCAVQYFGIYGRLWNQTGGLGTRYGAPGTGLPMSAAERYDRSVEEYEEHESRHRYYANNPDEDYTQEWGWS